MRIARFITGVGAVLVCGYVAAPSPLSAQGTTVTKSRPLILHKPKASGACFARGRDTLNREQPSF